MRRYAYVGMFVVAAVLTPPDVITQCGLAVPLILLYEVSIIAARFVEKKRVAGWVARHPVRGTPRVRRLMHDIRAIRDDPAPFDAAMARRGCRRSPPRSSRWTPSAAPR